MNRDYGLFTQAFEAGQVAAEDFSHIDHLGVAYEMLRTRPFLEAATQYMAGNTIIAIREDKPERVNLTITLVFLGSIAERINHSASNSFPAFLAENPDLCEREHLLQWYTPERLNSDLARTSFVMPEPRRKQKPTEKAAPQG